MVRPPIGYFLKDTRFPRIKLEEIAQLPDRDCYSYVMTTLLNVDGKFWQKGSGPNLQGSRMTLTTCKHQMRSFRAAKDWPGVWVAGYCSVKANHGKNALGYLMRVQEAYDNYLDYWYALGETDSHIKNAAVNPCGDAFRYKGDGEVHDPENFHGPCKDHTQAKNWSEFFPLTYHGRRHNLLIGDPEYSFVIDEPEIYWNPHGNSVGKIGRAEPKYPLSHLAREILSPLAKND